MTSGYTFGELLKKYRKWAGLTQAALAARIGRGRTTISNWERNANSPENRDTVLEISEALGLDGNRTNELLNAAGYAPRPLDGENAFREPLPPANDLSYNSADNTARKQTQYLETVKQLLQEQRQGLKFFPQYKTSIENFLIAYLGTQDEPVPFGGRDRALSQLEEWRTNSPNQRLLLVAPAGRGKSALLVRWSQLLAGRKDVAVVFMPISSRVRTNGAEVTFSCLASHLAYLYDKQIPTDFVSATPHFWRGLVADYLRHPLPDGRRLLLILDGLDEAVWDVGEDMFPVNLPPTVRLVVSARFLAGEGAPPDPWMRHLGWDRFSHLAETLTLDILTPEGVQDVLLKMGFPLNQVGLQIDVVGELYRLSEGDPLLVELYVKDLWAKGETVTRLKPEDLHEIEPGYEGFFDRWWDDQQRIWEQRGLSLESHIHTLLDLFAAALGPLSVEDLEAIVIDDSLAHSRAITTAIRPLKRIVLGDGREQGYVLAHPRLSQYFWDLLSERRREELDNRFIGYCQEIVAALKNQGRDAGQISDYAIRYYGAHLERAEKVRGRMVSLKELSTPFWLRAWETISSSSDGFFTDLGRLWEAASAKERLDLEVRCALIESTIHSLAQLVDIELYKNMILYKSDVLSPLTILTRLRNLPLVYQRADALHDLAEVGTHMTEEIMTYALELALEIAHENERGLIGLATCLTPDLMLDALPRMQDLSEYKQMRVIEIMAERRNLPADVVAMVLTNIENMKKPGARSAALSALIPHTQGAQQQEITHAAVREVQKSSWSPWCARSFQHLAPSLPDDAIQRLWRFWLNDCSKHWLGDSKDETFVWLAREYVARGWADEALKSLKQLPPDAPLPSGVSRYKIIASLAPVLSRERLRQLLDQAPSGDFQEPQLAKTLGVLAKYASDELLEEVLARAHSIADRWQRLVALSLIASQIKDSHERRVIWQEFRDLWLTEIGARALSRGKISDLLGIVDRLPDHLLEETARNAVIPKEIKVALLSRLPPIRREKFSDHLIEQFRDSDFNTGELDQLAPHLLPSKREELFSILLSKAGRLKDTDRLERALIPYRALTTGNWPDLDSNSYYYTVYDNLRVLTNMASCRNARGLATLAVEALETHPANFLKYYSRSVIPLLPNVTDSECNRIVSDILSTLETEASDPFVYGGDDYQAYHYRLLLKSLSGTPLSLVHDKLLTFEGKEKRQEHLLVLCKLFDLLPQSARIRLLREGSRWLQSSQNSREAINLTSPKAIKRDPTRALIFAVLAVDALPRERRYYIKRSLQEIEEFISQPLLRETQHDESARLCAQVASILAIAAPSQAELLFERALALANRAAAAGSWAASRRGHRDSVLLLWLPPELHSSVLIESIKALSALNDYFREDYKTRPDILIDLVSFWIRLPRTEIREIWSEVLPVLAKSDRRFFSGDLHALAPVIFALGGEVAVQSAENEIALTFEQWP